jgi:hypothetical protein
MQQTPIDTLTLTTIVYAPFFWLLGPATLPVVGG